jgi:A/G-specific adenine glycosylase
VTLPPEAKRKTGKRQAADSSRGDELRRSLLAWFDRAKRPLPWRATRDPYAIWLSEVMSQQTRVETVIPYYEKFLSHYPNVERLAEAPVEEVLGHWSGLGYYRRARMLHRTAQEVARMHGGVFPRTRAALEALPGVGPYTAGAVASIAFDEPAGVVDGNVVRVFARLFDDDTDGRTPAGLAHFRARADALVPAERAGDWNQALMELGATVCVPREPRCLLCPVAAACEGRARGTAHALPRLAKKAKPVPAAFDALVVTSGASVLLAERQAEGLFGGLLEPPLYDAAPTLLEAAQAAKLDLADPVGQVGHTLSHRKLAVAVHRADRPLRRAPRLPLSDAYVALHVVPWPLPDGARVSTLARKILALALET